MSNIDKIRQAMPEYKCSAMLITDQINRLFATGFSSSAGALLVTEKNAWFFIDSRYDEAARAAIKDADVTLVTKDEKLTDCIKAVINKNNISSVGFEDGCVSYASFKEWKEKLGIELIPAQKLVDNIREIKSRADIDKMIKAQRLSEKVFNKIIPLINTDMTEKELAAEIIYCSLKNGADDKAFDPIVVSGPNSSRPHGVPSNEKLKKGFLTIDFGVKLDGWCSDTTRTLCIGKPDDEMVNVYETVLKAQEAGIKAVHGGVKGIDVDSAARMVIEDAGYGDYFGHGFGHSIGLEVHESLKASQLSEDILPAGAVISAEPGIYLPGRFGVRIEDILYITEDGCENITILPKQLTVL
ncbi:MAG: aminopeptidase P family protein [Oscillospiraceae bacterium]|nr:aminopeptidase P family protein [Oscillospiraceae bacterium]